MRFPVRRVGRVCESHHVVHNSLVGLGDSAHPTRHRRGASLVELLVVISLLSAVTLFVGRMLYGLFRAERASARDLVRERRVAELAVQFREDVHLADVVMVAGQGLRLECTGPADRQVVYTVSADLVQREAPSHRESYRLPGCTAEFRTATEGVTELVVAHPLPQLGYTPAAPVRGGLLTVQAAPRRYAAALSGKE
jgi:hypothetical protein